jgi:flagellar basal body-associated protein FliL
MAEDQEATENPQELTSDEATELERLLEDTGSEVAAAGGLKGKLNKILSNKKLLMIFGGGLLVLLLAIGAGVYFLLGSEEAKVPVEEVVNEEAIVEEEETVNIEKVNIYKLEPFFLPIRDNGKETGQFISVTANFLLSNRVLNHEIDKILPLIRKNVYAILRRKRPRDFTSRTKHIEERIKKEMLIASNSLLLSGTGTITDVYFTQFMIK